MASEARIVINGTVLSDEQSMTVRLAMDALAHILSNEVGLKDAGIPVSDAYMTAISRVQALLAMEAPSVN